LGARWIALTQRLTLRAGCGYRIGFYDTDTLLASDSRVEEDVEQTTWTASLGATWRIRKIYDVVISQGYDHVGYSDDAAESYTRNATRLSVGRDF
jgi:long-subunit fatty acid transport protein